MKKLIKNTGLMLLTLFCMVHSSCSKDNEPVSSRQEQVTVTLAMDSRGGELDKDVKDLHVLFVQNSVVIAHVNYNETNPLSGNTIKVIGIKRVATDIYAIANTSNIESLENLLDEIKDGDEIPANFEQTILNGIYPKVVAVDDYLPMSAKVSITNEEMRNAQNNIEKDVALLRAVARLDINIINTTSGSFTVNKINFGEFLAGGTYLFEGDKWNNFKQPSPGIDPTEISNNDNKTFSYYIYESPEEQSSYTIALDAAGAPDAVKTPVCFMDNAKDESGNPVTSIKRNMHVIINATVESTGMPIHLNVDVLEWISKPLGPTYQ